uniref:Uncharacterized protein n=1 Tax=Aegilops tauschii subsp. strangulata TaxID=200361 RepID=A0A453C3J5_AEGTS
MGSTATPPPSPHQNCLTPPSRLLQEDVPPSLPLPTGVVVSSPSTSAWSASSLLPFLSSKNPRPEDVTATKQ